MKKNKLGKIVISLGILMGVGGAAFAGSTETEASTLYRAYNPNTGEHLYTQNANEIPSVVRAGWRSEGTAWEAPSKGAPVYRVFNPNNGGDHHYTLNMNEVNNLKSNGWRYEGVSWQSGGSTPVYRLYNPNAKSGTHHFTVNVNERNSLKRAGWRDEGVAFYSGKDVAAKPTTPTAPTQPTTPKPIDKIGNSGILEKNLSVAGQKGDAMRNDQNSKYYSGWFVVNEGSTDKVWAFKSREVRMSNGETWYTIDFYVDYV
ncbi:hypothetical protein [Enterococcus sp. AZ196]|uniref:hypothetical protein n=1 Tax=Enterococcus sp. AZ196 TaxID=2774659 RepID=UPI003D2D3779